MVHGHARKSSCEELRRRGIVRIGTVLIGVAAVVTQRPYSEKLAQVVKVHEDR